MVAMLYDWMTFLAKWLVLMYYGFSGFGLVCDWGLLLLPLFASCGYW